ncbi:MAG: tyrosine-type recombinase/integrase [Oceanococcus sp.]
MARTDRGSNLHSRTARLKLKEGKRHFAKSFQRGAAIGYRRGGRRSSWFVRLSIGDGQYTMTQLGTTDDFTEADGVDVLDYFQATEKARQITALHERAKAGEVGTSKATVNDALDAYLANADVEGKKTAADMKRSAKNLIRPTLGKILLSKLRKGDVSAWRDDMAAHTRTRSGNAIPVDKTDVEALRRSRSKTNRLLNTLKAALNYAYNNHMTATDAAWKTVKPFKNVDAPKIDYLTIGEATRLVNASAPPLKPLVQAALYTGARYGELTAAKVRDYNPDAKTLYLAETKNGKPRHVPLTDQGAALFERAAAGKQPTDYLWIREDGLPWGKSHQTRPMKKACEAANLRPIGFHILRHTYASQLVMKGTPLQVVSKVLGHSDTRITEKHYAHLASGHIEKTIREHLPDIGGFKPDNVTALKTA